MDPYSRRFDNPLTRLLALVIGAAAMVGAFFVGAFVLTVAIGLFVVVALVFSARVWWLRRQMRQAAKRSGRDQAESTVIEGEYIVHQRRERPGRDDFQR